MDAKTIERFGFKRHDDIINPTSNETRARFSKLINTNTTPHHIWITQAGYNDEHWHVTKEGVHIVNVSTPDELESVIFVLSGFKTKTFVS